MLVNGWAAQHPWSAALANASWQECAFGVGTNNLTETGIVRSCGAAQSDGHNQIGHPKSSQLLHLASFVPIH